MGFEPVAGADQLLSAAGSHGGAGPDVLHPQQRAGHRDTGRVLAAVERRPCRWAVPLGRRCRRLHLLGGL